MQKYEHIKDIPLLPTIIVLMLGLWGAILNFYRRGKMIQNYPLIKKIILFIIDVLTSSGTAIMVFYGLVGYGLNEPLSVAIAGVSAYHGTNLIYYIELYLASKFGTEEVVEAIKEIEENQAKVKKK